MNYINMNEFMIFLEKSENLRRGYKNSLEKADANFKIKWLKLMHKESLRQSFATAFLCKSEVNEENWESCTFPVF